MKIHPWEDDGGPAFPTDALEGVIFKGMSLRDYFAGQALAGLYANDVVINRTLMAPKDIAAAAYEAADAMLKARSR